MKVEIKIDKVFVIVTISALLFGNLLYMWGRHIGLDNNDEVEEQVEIIRTQLSQILGDYGAILANTSEEYKREIIYDEKLD